MVDRLTFVDAQGNPLHLFAVVAGTKYLSADAYIALRDYPKDEPFTIGERRVQFTTAQPLHAGLWLYPGDPEALGRLPEAVLFGRTGA